MKQILLLFIALFFLSPCFAQKQTRVTMKNGAVVTGILVSFNPTSHLILNVGGCDTRIEMKDVTSVENGTVSEVPPETTLDSTSNGLKGDNIDSMPDYPDFFIMRVGPYEVEMVLIRGGQFAMGYDGRGSLDMWSEPVHDVILSDYYVNKKPITEDVVGYLTNGRTEYTGARYYSPRGWRRANSIAEALANETELPLGLITEAQWEYLATGNDIKLLKLDSNEYNYCFDFLSEYVYTSRPILDPIGPESGSRHVKRSFGESHSVYDRKFDVSVFDHSAVRVTFPASAFHYDILIKTKR